PSLPSGRSLSDAIRFLVQIVGPIPALGLLFRRKVRPAFLRLKHHDVGVSAYLDASQQVAGRLSNHLGDLRPAEYERRRIFRALKVPISEHEHTHLVSKDGGLARGNLTNPIIAGD